MISLTAGREGPWSWTGRIVRCSSVSHTFTRICTWNGDQDYLLASELLRGIVRLWKAARCGVIVGDGSPPKSCVSIGIVTGRQ